MDYANIWGKIGAYEHWKNRSYLSIIGGGGGEYMLWSCENCAGKVDPTRWSNYVLILRCFVCFSYRKLNKNHNK